ncbi:070a6588-50c7-4612-96c1-fcf61e33454d [Thermothielavioides terrestris]|uniref:070a6588-50c7-4612-96c1-fcf61e33454d n=1 Tax=Thermothielavioides terrestris TaxID=2587410 RepID=A0A3S4APT2_9PEZI|nr:070a6588-50c7-4612-96c1-fcf61e33454d [Thermothielavioides terrestris]
MSLNGLDDVRVKEAYEAAVAEPGGWFLLKYATRDEVELLGRGNGGIVEIRNNIAQYEEKSPLYGFLRYRRRSVIVKYLPEDCSRLIQARVTVHFDAVCDRFSPYDTTFSIADAKELKDNKLSAACSLHAASGSTSSSTSSLRRRRLMEIAEEEEEEERERKRQSVVKEEERPRSPTASTTEPPVKLDAELAKSPEASRFAADSEFLHFTGAPRPSSPAKSFDETGRRMSSQSSRTDLYPTTSHPYSKPRVKLGPRPSADLAGRPRSSAGSTTHRPVATVPSGLKSYSKGTRKGRAQSHTQDEEGPEFPIKEQAEDLVPAVEAVTVDDKPSDAELPESTASSGTQPPVTSTSAPKPSVQPPNKQNTMTPEKARLLKAMKLREKKMMMSSQPTLGAPATDIPSAPSTPGPPEEKPEFETAGDEASVGEAADEGDGQPDDPAGASHADSGVDIGTDHASVDTQMDSHPTSPLAGSEIGDSTQASSPSESTDETVLAKDHDLASERGKHEAHDNDLAASTPDETSPSAENTDEIDSGLPDRQSVVTITAADGDRGILKEPPVTAESKTESKEPATSDEEVRHTVAESSPMPPSSEVPAPSTVQGESTSDAAAPETAAHPAPVSRPVEAETDPADAGRAPEEKPASPQLPIPLSKFATTHETKSPVGSASQSIPSNVAETSNVDSWRAGNSPPPVPPKDNTDAADDIAETAGKESKKRQFPEPIRTDLDAADNDKRRSVISILDNDGFMDELQSATVQEATPITVSKSPISPFFSLDQNSKRATGGPENFTAPRFTRTVSSPVRNSFLAPGEAAAGAARSASSGAPSLQKSSAQQTAADLRPKSAKLGSSISQRIKALEKLSGSTATAEAAPRERPASTFFAVRKASTREPSRSPSVVDRASSFTRGPTPSPPPSRQSSPEAGKVMGRGRSGSLVNRLSMFEGGMPPRGRPESVQVTARIVRDPNQPFPRAPQSKGGSVDPAPLELKQSPLLVDVQNRAPSHSPVRPPSVMSAHTLEREIAVQAKQTLLERRLSKQSQEGDKEAAKPGAQQGSDGPRPRRRSSLSVVKDFIKDRTESLMSAKSPSTDNLGITASSAPTGLSSPATAASSRSPSRPPSAHQGGSLTRRLSIGSRRSSTEQSRPAVSAAGMSAARAADGTAASEWEAKNSSTAADKKPGPGSPGPASPNQSKGNRATRFMRRLSNTLVTGRKNTAPSISPTVAEEDAAEVEAASRGSTATSAAAQSQPSIVAFMGDVNVQFPDNLLWKRRSICLDSQGFLILSAVQGTAMVPSTALGKDKHGAMVKRYHMSDFKAPYAPDVELQELPNSVVLDLVDGSALQIACEDRAGQMSILHILEEAHRNHANFGH